eukprot:gene9584-17340_t
MANLFFFAAALIFTCLVKGNLIKWNYWNTLSLDHNKKYELSWKVNKARTSINLRVKVQTTGWIGFGISKGLSGKIADGDLAIGWVDSHGRAFLKDCHGTKHGLSRMDKHQDLELVSSHQTTDSTTLEFKRKLITCDNDDRNIKEGTLKIMFGWGSKDPDGVLDACSILSRNSSKLESKSINLLNIGIQKELPSGTKYVDLLHRKVKVPAKRTTYWCTPFKIDKLVNLTTPKHFIEIHPKVQKRKKSLVHHMVLYACNYLSEEDLAFSGECQSSKTPQSVSSCAGTGGIFAFGHGGVNFRFPDDVGYAIGTKESSKYYVLESHFNNEDLKKDLVDTSGFRMFYSEPRKYEAAMLTVGASITDNIIIPPGMSRWTLKGVCTKSCTQKLDGSGPLSRKSIKIFASFPHAHGSAIAIHTTVVRNGLEVEELVRNDNFDPNYQQTLMLNKEVEVEAGDDIFTYCTYRTLNKKYATLGGMGSNREMCFNFMMYYPRANLTTCTSDEMVVQPVFTSAYANPVFPQWYV